jgi:hypothetical protein
VASQTGLNIEEFARYNNPIFCFIKKPLQAYTMRACIAQVETGRSSFDSSDHLQDLNFEWWSGRLDMPVTGFEPTIY